MIIENKIMTLPLSHYQIVEFRELNGTVLTLGMYYHMLECGATAYDPAEYMKIPIRELHGLSSVYVSIEKEPEPEIVPVVTVLLGNLTFSQSGDSVTIHSITGAYNVPANEAEAFGDNLLNTYPAYLIPATFNGEIIWDAVGKGDGTLLKQHVQEIADAYEERRSDVSEILNRLCETGEVDLSLVEHRFAKIELPTDLPTGTCIQYDTLTTLFSIYDPEANNTVIDTGELDHNYE